MLVWIVIVFLACIVVAEFIAEMQDHQQEKRDREMLKKLLKDTE